MEGGRDVFHSRGVCYPFSLAHYHWIIHTHIAISLHTVATSSPRSCITRLTMRYCTRFETGTTVQPFWFSPFPV